MICLGYTNSPWKRDGQHAKERKKASLGISLRGHRHSLTKSNLCRVHFNRQVDIKCLCHRCMNPNAKQSIPFLSARTGETDARSTHPRDDFEWYGLNRVVVYCRMRFLRRRLMFPTRRWLVSYFFSFVLPNGSRKSAFGYALPS